jgi:TRAP-type mannitol/chloroaromatic compound transport system permease large subunit
MAMSAYYLKGVAPAHVLLSTIFRGCLPFVSMVFVAMAAIYVFPSLVNWLPELLYSR